MSCSSHVAVLQILPLMSCWPSARGLRLRLGAQFLFLRESRFPFKVAADETSSTRLGAFQVQNEYSLVWVSSWELPFSYHRSPSKNHKRRKQTLKFHSLAGGVFQTDSVSFSQVPTLKIPKQAGRAPKLHSFAKDAQAKKHLCFKSFFLDFTLNISQEPEWVPQRCGSCSSRSSEEVRILELSRRNGGSCSSRAREGVLVWGSRPQESTDFSAHCWMNAGKLLVWSRCHVSCRSGVFDFGSRLHSLASGGFFSN